MRAFAARGKTVIFATHYLEEADAFADRIVLMAHGRVVADGSSTEIKARVGWPDDPGDPRRAPTSTRSRRCPGSRRRTPRRRRDPRLPPTPTTALRGLLASSRRPHDIEVRGAGLEEAFLELTGDGNGEERTNATGGRTDAPPPTLRYELLRTFRNRRFLLFSLAFPLVLFFLVAGPNRHQKLRRHRLPAVLHGGHGGAGAR